MKHEAMKEKPSEHPHKGHPMHGHPAAAPHGHAHRAKGGRIGDEGGLKAPKVMKTEEHETEEEDEAEKGVKHGGSEDSEKPKEVMQKRKRGGRVHGDKPAARLDRRARGGGIGHGANATSNPYSGADAPNLSYAKGGPQAVDEHGAGKKI